MTHQNKKLVHDFYDLASNQHKPRDAVKRYIGDQYIQHNPFAPNGVAPFVEHFESYFREHQKSHVLFSHIVAEGDLMVIPKRTRRIAAGRSLTYSAWKTASSLSTGTSRKTFQKKRPVATQCSERRDVW